ncbi:hypothetical protein EJ08DRAFT_728871 [Tothia fuscella]|uniref:Uncharacterized protein n=1 Tax=Tothia fuscella TaxID=1048955 RepID=A0A9P4P2Y3_9PEZI|nr:hypothetical protein EJ08DRAFT_728871 [Tothia fuscella]
MASTNPLHFLNLRNLPASFPTANNRITNFDPEVVASDALHTNIVLHPRLPNLFTAFLAHKREHGSVYEKELYASPDTFTWRTLATRLIEKRPLAFVGASDSTVLRNGQSLRDSREWDRNGTSQQDRNEVLTLKKYLSYDEIMLSSLIAVSGPTYFINKGDRYNGAELARKGTFEERGIIVGVVGARFERRDKMDSLFVLEDFPSSTQHPKLTNIFLEFFGGRDPSSPRFDVGIFKSRIQITAETLLLEANDRAEQHSKTAFVHVVGLGLGVWQIHPTQPQWYIEVFTSIMQNLQLPHISTIAFSWIPIPISTQDDCVAAGKSKDIAIQFNKRNPADKLNTDELLVVSYAWDGNSFPGNEFWWGSLSGSGDPAAACHSTIAELHNPLVNPFTDRVDVKLF